MSSAVHRSLSGTLLILGILGIVTTALGGCGGGAVETAPPSPRGRAAAGCRALHDALPGKLNGLARRATEPESDLTAAWGDPAVVLRCGVSRPDVLTPGNEEYNPLAKAAEVNGVDWLVEERDGGYRFTTINREAHIQVTVPDDYHPEIDPLVDLAEAVKKSDPKTL